MLYTAKRKPFKKVYALIPANHGQAGMLMAFFFIVCFVPSIVATATLMPKRCVMFVFSCPPFFIYQSASLPTLVCHRYIV